MLDGRGQYVFGISGSNFHRIGSLIPVPGDMPKFDQLYIYDTEHEMSNTVRIVQGNRDANEFDLNVLKGLQTMLNDTNPYVKVFRNARDRLSENGTQNMHIRILHSREGRQYARPTANEVATIIVVDESEITGNHDIIVRMLDGNLQRINKTHPSYMPLQYPLFFPYETDGWNKRI